MPELTPVDHDPFGSRRAKLIPVDNDPFPEGAAFGVGSPAETSQQPSGLGNMVSGAFNGLGDLARRAIGNSQTALETGTYNPRPVLEAAMLPMGTGAVAGVPVKGAEAVLGAGPIRAYHGSPHDFDAFSMDKIGTGEGAQAYGHGLYFAENEGVAKGYRDRLGTRAAIPNTNVDSPQSFAALAVQAGGEDAARRRLASNMQTFSPGNAVHEKSKAALAAIDDGSYKSFMPDPGHMYEVQINADPEHFLDWDKPLSEQHPEVRSRLSDIQRWQQVPAKNNVGAETTGSQLVDYLERRFGNKIDATNEFNDAGIPGIKYLDQGSRASGDGSRNYVVFNDKLIDIVKKYAAAGIALPPAVAAAYDQAFKPVDHDPFGATQ